MTLIERLSKATGPDRELDAMLAVAVDFGCKKNLSDDLQYCQVADKDCAVGTYWFKQRNGYSLRTAPAFTASIDSALMLVPEGFRWKLGYTRHVPCVAEVVDYRIQMEPNVGRFDGECDSTHAIALCIAALKAVKRLYGEQDRGSNYDVPLKGHCGQS